ncbi:MAG: imidazoleglycerol-phosphate dehydratase HisB [Nitrososphaerota archaeon]|nr:imidazoleglycerol-phosphate dehydratase HisB [Candidatus Bathyarchaeota archaeon]MDW8048491.1 imidazoleglycerol-phosphate dehydratase HisB [Nitrososphaerota archaeon]
MRVGETSRRTKETEVSVKVNLDGTGNAKVKTGYGFLDHMLSIFAMHSLIDLEVIASGDLIHHVVEDVAICLGEAILKALGAAEGIKRFGHAIVPMDCSLAVAAVDLAKRPYCKIEMKMRGKKIEDMPCENIQHFLETLASAMRANVHLIVHYGSNDHHKVEASFKALALSLREAASIDSRRIGVPSSKGVL